MTDRGLDASARWIAILGLGVASLALMHCAHDSHDPPAPTAVQAPPTSVDAAALASPQLGAPAFSPPTPGRRGTVRLSLENASLLTVTRGVAAATGRRIDVDVAIVSALDCRSVSIAGDHLSIDDALDKLATLVAHEGFRVTRAADRIVIDAPNGAPACLRPAAPAHPPEPAAPSATATPARPSVHAR